MSRSQFVLTCPAGRYEADTLGSLLLEVIRHRLWHLWHDGEWRD